ncbi:hypothetical protein DFH11DRAFT_163642 [Phellopilus nigrolimitatus]|nr:hypothetical protein DFH11DRAFT_163642 [Phellopilus nigrolimitatus]
MKAFVARDGNLFLAYNLVQELTNGKIIPHSDKRIRSALILSELPLAPLVALLIASGIHAETLIINTPTNVVQCEPALLTWQGGVSPYFLVVLPGGELSATPLEDLGEKEGTSLSWLVNIAAGTSVGLKLSDSTGAVAQSAPFTIQSSSDASCLH